MAIASATVLGLWGSQAAALSLGRIAVQSALGEPLRAEIEILEINADEASSLKTRIASPDTFAAAGLEYSPSLNGLQISLQQQNGRSFLRLTSQRSVNDPYLDLILEASWASGRIVRDYTMLFDPPNLKQPQAVAPTAPQVSSVPLRIAPAAEPVAAVPSTPEPASVAQPVAVAPSTPEPAPVAQPVAVAPKAPEPAPQPVPAAPPSPELAPAAEPVAVTDAAPAAEPVAAAPSESEIATATPVQTPAGEPAKAVKPSDEPSPAPAPFTPAAPADVAKRITVKAGDTAGRIATNQKITGISLEQMLVAMQRTNPEAFIGGNVNRIRAGAVLTMPGADEARATTPVEAHKIVVAHSRDFNEFRRRLASNAPVAPATAADRKASGSVEAKVEEKKPATAAPDKLTLSKGAVQGKSPEDKIAKERGAKEAAARADEISKNIADLDKLSKAAVPAAAASAAKPASAAPAVAVVTQAKPAATPAVPAPAPAPVASAPAAASPPPQAASSAPAKRPAVPIPAPVAEEPDLIDELLDNPMVPAAAGGLVALLAGLAFYRSRQRKNAAQVDSAYLESRLQPDSFFGASGGQRIDTNDQAGSSANSSSMVYSPSQLDAADDVDPVAEADVYLAYGRDLQAEEILKEALRNHPTRVAIHQKLLEIYAKRRDVKSFGNIAKEAHKLTAGAGPEWEQVCELGRSIDPSNPLYQAGGAPARSRPAPLEAAAERSGFAPTAARPAVAAPPAPAPAPSAVDLDLDLDFSTEGPQPSAISQVAGLSSATIPAPVASAGSNSLEFEAPSLPELTLPSAEPAKPAADAGMMNFDLGGLSLDLGTPSEQPSAASDDPLATKLALADEFNAIGDTDGARALIEEIIAEASGDMKARAQKALSRLG